MKIVTSSPTKRPTPKQLDRLWSEAVKLRAGEKSERSGKDRDGGHTLHAHHILGKATHRLRWELDNGVCITGGEHKFIAHGATQIANRFREWALEKRKATKKMELLKWVTGGVDRYGVYLHLKQAIKRYQKELEL